MIVKNGDKSKQIYIGGDRIYRIYLGEELIYNCYTILEHEVIHLNLNGEGWQNISSNTQWINQ